MMESGDSWALAELDRVVGGESLQSRPKNPRFAGGEWDYINALPSRTRRRLVGAGYMRPNGHAPDQLAELIVPRVAGIEAVDDAMRWYVKTCLAALAERRLVAERRRRGKLARRNGFKNYYEYRDERARDEGYASLWEKRKAKWS